MARQFIVTPPYEYDVEVGPGGPAGISNMIYVGRLAERGALRKVYFNAGREFVALILGKRGSGKSYTLGVLLEGLATKSNETSLSKLTTRPGVLLLDPMMNFWPFEIPVTEDGTEKIKQQFKLLDGWGCKAEDSNVELWLPRGFKRNFDYPNIKDFSLRTSDLDPQDWADIVGVNLVRDPQGMLLAETLDMVTALGWTDSEGNVYSPNQDFEIVDLINYIQHGRSDYHHTEVGRALMRTLDSWSRQAVFQSEGTSLRELVRPGSLSILMLPQRIGHDLRKVISRVVIRRLLKEREAASQIRQRLDVQIMPETEYKQLDDELSRLVPKTILAIDEAQELLGDDGGEARQALEDFCLQGRNFGLSLILATQRPTVSAISAKVKTQVDTYFIHSLLTHEDIENTERNKICIFPEEFRLGDQSLDYSRLLRSLDTGQCLVTSSRISSKGNVRRAFIADIRPRTRVHGGEVS
jgi:DNA helicase HerA-like ATPase